MNKISKILGVIVVALMASLIICIDTWSSLTTLLGFATITQLFIILGLLLFRKLRGGDFLLVLIYFALAAMFQFMIHAPVVRLYDAMEICRDIREAQQPDRTPYIVFRENGLCCEIRNLESGDIQKRTTWVSELDRVKLYLRSEKWRFFDIYPPERDGWKITVGFPMEVKADVIGEILIGYANSASATQPTTAPKPTTQELM